MKKSILTCTLAGTLSFMMAACDSNKTAETTTNSDTLLNSDTGIGAKADNTINKMNMDTGMNSSAAAMATAGPNDFVTKAAGGGMMEVELGKTAQKNAAGKEVKEYGKMMETDHTKANNELKKIAANKNISLPDALPREHAMHVSDMQSKTGNDFDKAYIKMMVEDHNKVIEMFRKAATDNTDKDIRDFASKTLPVLEKHLAEAKAIKEKL